MKRCQSCGTGNLDTSVYCDECGTRLPTLATSEPPPYKPPTTSSPGLRVSNVTSVGIPPLVEKPANGESAPVQTSIPPQASHSRLVIERGEGVSTEFVLSAEESTIGRWDADNGIFPDVDLDAFDPDAKVSRRHARVIFRDNVYMIEDLGSTNGTFVNRGRRLLPGSPQVISEGDEIIVGKTFLRFHINR